MNKPGQETFPKEGWPKTKISNSAGAEKKKIGEPSAQL